MSGVWLRWCDIRAGAGTLRLSGLIMKKTRSTTLRRAWPSSEFSDRASDRTRSRSEKDYRLHKHYPKHFISHCPRGFMIAGQLSFTLHWQKRHFINLHVWSHILFLNVIPNLKLALNGWLSPDLRPWDDYFCCIRDAGQLFLAFASHCLNMLLCVRVLAEFCCIWSLCRAAPGFKNSRFDLESVYL